MREMRWYRIIIDSFFKGETDKINCLISVRGCTAEKSKGCMERMVTHKCFLMNGVLPTIKFHCFLHYRLSFYS